MSAKTAKFDEETEALIEQGCAGTDLSKKALLKKALRYYVPRVLKGEISIVEADEQKQLPFVAAGGAR